jgi:hypothetical protein
MAELAELQGMDGLSLADIRVGIKLAPQGAGGLLAALCQLPPSDLPAPITGHHEWLTRQEGRTIQD